MNGPRNPTLLVYLIALCILLAFLLALTLVVTAGPLSDRNDNYPMSLTILTSNGPGNANQCVEKQSFSVQETCPKISYDKNFGYVNYSGE